MVHKGDIELWGVCGSSETGRFPELVGPLEGCMGLLCWHIGRDTDIIGDTTDTQGAGFPKNVGHWRVYLGVENMGRVLKTGVPAHRGIKQVFFM